MALVRTVRLTASAADHGTGPFATDPFTPAPNALLVVIAYVSQEGGTTDPSGDLSISDSEGLVWTPRANVGNPAFWSCGMRAWTARAGPSPVPMALTIDCAGRDAFEYCVAAIDYAGFASAGPVGVIAIDPSLGTDGAAGFALPAAPAESSEVLAAIGRDFITAGGSTVAPGAGWTEVVDFATTSAFSHLQLQARGGSASTAVDWADIRVGDDSDGQVAKTIGLALEIVAGAAGVELAGTAVAEGAAVAGLRVRKPLAGSAAGAGTAAAGLTVAKRLAGAATGTALARASLRVAKPLSATAVGEGEARASLRVASVVELAGAAVGEGLATGQLTVGKPLAGTAAAEGAAAAALRVERRLAAAASGRGFAAGAIRVTKRLAGSGEGAGFASAALRIGLPIDLSGEYALATVDTRTAISVGESRLVASAPDGRTVGSAMDTRTVATAAATRTEVEV